MKAWWNSKRFQELEDAKKVEGKGEMEGSKHEKMK